MTTFSRDVLIMRCPSVAANPVHRRETKRICKLGLRNGHFVSIPVRQANKLSGAGIARIKGAQSGREHREFFALSRPVAVWWPTILILSVNAGAKWIGLHPVWMTRITRKP